MKRIGLALLTFSALALAPHTLWAQAIQPPNTFHPYRGGTNCIQVADAQGNFNCAGGTSVDPATGNMVISGTISFTSTGGFSATYFPGVVVGAVGLGAQVLGTSDLVIATSPTTVAPAGPRILGVVLRVRSDGPGRCQLVVAGGNGLQEWGIPVIPIDPLIATLPSRGVDLVMRSFPGGAAGC